MDIISREDSPAGWLLQGNAVLVFVGACLQAMCAGQRASPPAKIRQQAGSYKGTPSCFCRGLPASDVCRSTGITSCEDSPAGWLLQGREWLFVFVEACLQAMRAGQRASPPAKIRQQAGSYREGIAFCLCRSLPASDACRARSIALGLEQLAGLGRPALKNPQCKCRGLRPPPWPPLPEPPRPRGGRPSCMELTSSSKRFSNS